jgi:hypothetical protein
MVLGASGLCAWGDVRYDDCALECEPEGDSLEGASGSVREIYKGVVKDFPQDLLVACLQQLSLYWVSNVQIRFDNGSHMVHRPATAWCVNKLEIGSTEVWALCQSYVDEGDNSELSTKEHSASFLQAQD